MSAIRTEPRTAMMALVEVSWEDQFGTRHTSSARLEDTSLSGACLRVKVPVAIGSAMNVNSYRERFSGTARYCRTDRRDFVVGVQKDKNANRSLTDVVVPDLPPSVPSRNVPIAAVGEEVHDEVRDTPREERQRAELPRESQHPAAASAVRTRPSIAVMPSRDGVSVTDNASAAQSSFNRQLSLDESNDSPPPARFQFQSARSGNPKRRENMPNKWSDLAPWRQKQTGRKRPLSRSHASHTRLEPSGGCERAPRKFEIGFESRRAPRNQCRRGFKPHLAGRSSFDGRYLPRRRNSCPANGLQHSQSGRHAQATTSTASPTK